MSVAPKPVVAEEAIPIQIAGIEESIVAGAVILESDVKDQRAIPVWLQATDAAKAVIQSWAGGGGSSFGTLADRVVDGVGSEANTYETASEALIAAEDGETILILTDVLETTNHGEIDKKGINLVIVGNGSKVTLADGTSWVLNKVEIQGLSLAKTLTNDPILIFDGASGSNVLMHRCHFGGGGSFFIDTVSDNIPLIILAACTSATTMAGINIRDEGFIDPKNVQMYNCSIFGDLTTNHSGNLILLNCHFGGDVTINNQAGYKYISGCRFAGDLVADAPWSPTAALVSHNNVQGTLTDITWAVNSYNVG